MAQGENFKSLTRSLYIMGNIPEHVLKVRGFRVHVIPISSILKHEYTYSHTGRRCIIVSIEVVSKIE